MKTISRILVCVLGAIFIFSSLGVAFAVDPSPSPTPVPTPEIIPDPLLEITYATAMRYIYECMRAWGIEIDYNGYREFGDEINGVLIEWVMEFLDTLPSSYSISTWIAPWQANNDYWGNFQLNNSALEDIQDFVDWLISKFGLTNNNTVVINPTYTANGYTLYEFNKWYYADGNYYYLEFQQKSGTLPEYWMPVFFTNAQYPQLFCVISRSQYTGQAIYYMSNDLIHLNNYGTYNIYYTNATLNSNGCYYQGITWYTEAYPSNGNYLTVNDYSGFVDIANTLQIQEYGDIAIAVSVIDLPDGNPSYTPGDGITIIDNTAEYGEITFSGVVTNLPAIVSTGTIPTPGDELNPGLVNAWHPISTLIEMTADSMGMLIGIVYEFPEEVLIPIFAVLGGIIIFGIIHAMKEH